MRPHTSCEKPPSTSRATIAAKRRVRRKSKRQRVKGASKRCQDALLCYRTKKSANSALSSPMKLFGSTASMPRAQGMSAWIEHVNQPFSAQFAHLDLEAPSSCYSIEAIFEGSFPHFVAMLRYMSGSLPDIRGNGASLMGKLPSRRGELRDKRGKVPQNSGELE